MTVLQISDVKDSCFKLISLRSGRMYDFYIEFYDTDVMPEKGDYLILADIILDGQCKLLSFSPDLNNRYGRDIRNMRIDEEGDIAILVKGNQGTVLKRLYG